MEKAFFQGNPGPGLGHVATHVANRSEGLGIMVGHCFSEVPSSPVILHSVPTVASRSMGKVVVNLINGTVYLALRLEENTDSHIRSDIEINSEWIEYVNVKRKKKERDYMFKLREGQTF